MMIRTKKTMKEREKYEGEKSYAFFAVHLQFLCSMRSSCVQGERKRLTSVSYLKRQVGYKVVERRFLLARIFFNVEKRKMESNSDKQFLKGPQVERKLKA